MATYSFETDEFEPDFYHLIRDGISRGRLLMFFALKKLVITEDGDIPKQKKPFKDAFELVRRRCDVEFAVIGIRNLPEPLKQPKLRFRMAGLEDDPEKQEISLDLNPQVDVNTLNPNIGQVFRFLDVELTEDPLYLPLLEVYIDNEGMMAENYFTIESLIGYCEWAREGRLEYIRKKFAASSREKLVTLQNKKKDVSDNRSSVLTSMSPRRPLTFS